MDAENRGLHMSGRVLENTGRVLAGLGVVGCAFAGGVAVNEIALGIPEMTEASHQDYVDPTSAATHHLRAAEHFSTASAALGTIGGSLLLFLGGFVATEAGQRRRNTSA